MDVRVRFLPSGRTVAAPSGTTLLAAVRRAGLPLASACGADGLCARCGVEVTRGADALSPEQAEERRAKGRNRVEDSLRLACHAKLQGDVEVTTPYW